MLRFAKNWTDETASIVTHEVCCDMERKGAKSVKLSQNNCFLFNPSTPVICVNLCMDGSL